MLSVTTFWTFLREFSPLVVCGGEIGGMRMIRSRVPGGVAGLFQESGREISVALPISSVK